MRKQLFKWGVLCLVTFVTSVLTVKGVTAALATPDGTDVPFISEVLQNETNGSVAAGQVPDVQEKELYSSDFTEWKALDATAEETVAHTVATKYSHEDLAFTVYNTNVAPDPNTIGIDWNKFDKDLVGGTLQAEKNGGSYIITSALASVTKVTFVHGATGGNRGWSLWAKGDGDDDWVQLTTTTADPAGWCEVSANVNRTNCQLKFTNIADAQNAYMFRLGIYGNVDMSLTPALSSFSFNGQTYQAADIFEETAAGVQEATIEISNSVEMPSESNPISEIICDNGEIDGDVAYTVKEDGSVVVTLKVTANGETMTYNVIFVHKPYFTLSYIDTDGTTVLEASQQVEKDDKIGTLRGYDGVTVADGMAMRGWFVSPEGGEKYTADYVVTSDMALYAVATDIETESKTARYTFDLTDEFFYDEDHEAFNAEGAKFHDATHGWTLESNGKIDLLVGGHAYIIATLCRYSKSNAKLTLTDPNGEEVTTVSGYSSTDGKTVMMEYTGGAGTLTLTASNEVYLHKLVIANVEGAPVEKNGQGYYVVRQGDGGNLLTVLDVVNSVPDEEGRVYVFLPDGKYDLGNEVLTPISRDNISIIGQSMDNTVIVNEAPVEGIGVSATFLITGSNTYFQDLTLQNAYDYYQPGFAGRAVVIQDKGKRTICKNVRLLSYQDTYYSNNKSQFYFEDSDIHGTVDFICGGGDVFFNHCTLTVEPRSADGSGECTITAPSTDVAGGNKYGYVFSGCTIDSKAERFNYGRAWNDRPRCAYLNTTLLQPERLNSNRWTTGGMNVPADKFVEYNTMDASGKVISPESWELTFTKDSKSNTFETILTDEQAAEYDIDKVFANWTPDEYAAQKQMGLLRGEGTTLTWDAVDGVKAYAVFFGGQFVGMTSTNSMSFAIEEVDPTFEGYTVRAANEHGGFGKPSSTTSTGINNVNVGNGSVVKTDYYSLQGSRVNASYKGVVIKVETLSNGTTNTVKIVK